MTTQRSDGPGSGSPIVPQAPDIPRARGLVTDLRTFDDPDNFPPRSERSRAPESLEELYSTRGVESSVIAGAPGLRMMWTVYRGAAKHVTFAPEQMKAWIDTRVWGNSPWSPPYILPEPPEDNRWVADVSFAQPGEYVLRAVASDGSHFSYENVTVTVTP